MKKSKNIFKLNRLSFTDLWNDALDHVKAVYRERKQTFNTASPFAQLLQVILHMSRMIFYYIEDSITELNLRTATRTNSIKGLAQLTGHNPSRSIASRGSIKITFDTEDSNMYGETVIIPNRTEILNTANGLVYTITMPTENIKFTMDQNNFIDLNVVQGVFEYQQATGTGEPLQSFNFSVTNAKSIDNYFINVYVNGKRWQTVDSLLDMIIDEECCIIRTGLNGGIDIFFGNGKNGSIPPLGSTILVEYLTTDGYSGNIDKSIVNNGDYWEFIKIGYGIEGDEINLNKCLNVLVNEDFVLGTNDEDILLTQMIAPNTSRSFVLANEINYKTFLKKLNIFSVIDVIRGYETSEDKRNEAIVEEIQTKHDIIKRNYNTALSSYGPDAEKTLELYDELQRSSNQLLTAMKMVEDNALNDNTIYLFLIPNIKHRINSTSNYFTASENVFELSEREQLGIINLIEESGSRITTVENKIIKPLYPRFSINVNVRKWEGYTDMEIYNGIAYTLSEYLIANDRRDRIPQSDFVRLIEFVDGVDSVNVTFDADVNNINIYKDSYGIDSHGDILLTRNTTDYYGNIITLNDIYPLFRGGFINNQGTSYSATQQVQELSALNVNFIGTTTKR